jgi:hypothetical protein
MNLPKRHQVGPRFDSECPPGTGQEADHVTYLNWVAEQVGKHGWAVPVAEAADGPPPWAYSIGVWLTSRFAELIVCGAPAKNMTGIIDAIATRVADGLELEPGDVLTDICPARLALRPVDLSWRMTSMFEVSDEFYGYVRPPYLQVVWADRAGRFPWEPRFQPSFAGAQPYLWLPKDDNPPGPWTRIDKTG